MTTGGESGAPYRRSVATASARLRSRFSTTISRAHPRTTIDKRQADPTAPAPITPTFMVDCPPCAGRSLVFSDADVFPDCAPQMARNRSRLLGSHQVDFASLVVDGGHSAIRRGAAGV